ncbi:DUF4012 domain-containing protein [Cellulomonas iranensis]|uniref:DUF4012 domain-containing protein n=1 Tax=Cellulomonas iranensis TaxID=76862 RepID=A0ABU0GGY7_9CELL|nr:DUF4012 domain-containing protein [Cellulomonas iranensis]MDQ0424608.1 hypothetical protein [Cellulomonas iranensis]
MTHPGWGSQWSGQAVPRPRTAQDPRSARRRPAGARPARRRRRGTRRRAVLLAVAGLLVLVVVAVAWLAWDAVRARSDLETARDAVARLQDQVVAGDVEGARATLPALREHAAAAHRRTTGPLWSVAGAVPWAGPNVRAVQAVTEAVDELAQHALPPLVEATALVDPAALRPVDGRVDVAPLADVASQVAAADVAVRATLDRLEQVDTGAVVAPVAEPVGALRDQLARVAADTGTAARAAALLPPMLGGDGPRQYLVLVQNNAEPRATGGISGAVLLLRAEDGRLEVVEQRSGNELTGLDDPDAELSLAEQDLFGPLLVTDMRDVNFTPDFPRSAQLARGLWARATGTQVDGVLSVDPVALALVLRATGPVTLADGSTLGADDAVGVLLNDVYLRFPEPARQDAYFADAASAVFSAVSSGQGEPAGVVDALAEAARRGRLLVWSADADLQAHLAGTVLAGELRGRAGDSPVVGLYLNDGTQAKLGYYLDVDAQVASTACVDGDAQRIALTATYRYAPPADVASLPPYVLGLDGVVPPGDFRTNVLLYLPEGAFLEDIMVDGRPVEVHAQAHDGLAVAALTWTFSPGQSFTLTANLVSGPEQSGEVLLRGTPTASGFDHVSSVSKCADRG